MFDSEVSASFVPTRAYCNCMYGKADWISTASGSERASLRAALATARGTDPHFHLSMPYIDLQSALRPEVMRHCPSFTKIQTSRRNLTQPLYCLHPLCVINVSYICLSASEIFPAVASSQ